MSKKLIKFMNKAFFSLLVLGVFLVNGYGNVLAAEIFQLDSKVKPGNSFYEYVNNTWVSANPIPDEKSSLSNWEVLSGQTEKNLRNIFETAAVNPKNENEKLIGKLYASAMNETAINKAGRTPIMAELQKIADIKNLNDLTHEVAYQHSLQGNAFFFINVSPDFSDSTMNLASISEAGIGLPEKSYYFDQDKADIRAKYVEHITKMFDLAGFSADESLKKAHTILKIETLLAKAFRSPEEGRDVEKNFNKKTVAGLEKLMPSFAWQAYFQIIGVPEIKKLNVAHPEYFEAMNKILVETPLSDLKDYLMWQWIGDSASFLSEDFVNERFDFYGKTLNGKKKLRERYERVYGVMNMCLRDVIGQIYVEKYFSPEAKKRAEALVENLRVAMREHIENVDWMSSETKKLALKKLDTMKVKIGYPMKWRDYSKIKLGDNYFENLVTLARDSFDYMIQKEGKPVDRDEWFMSPQTVNAYYNPSMNEIVFPAAILQAPFFDVTADDALNYGGIGTVIGHEITHAFDDQGRKFDANGNLVNWWTKEDEAHFNEKTKRLAEQFDQYKIDNGDHVNGNLTLGENIADLGGISVAYTAFRMTKPNDKILIENMTPNQRFFSNYARIWRINSRPESALLNIKTDSHSPAKFRVDGILSNLLEYFEAFGVKPGDALFRPENERVKIW